MDAEARFWSKVEKSDGCWMWTKGCISTGYGMFHISKTEQMLAHRYAYSITNGPIPDGLVVDHECHNETDCAGGRDCPHRKCVNPEHLRLKTSAQNLSDGPNYNSKKMRCPRQHEYDEENTYVNKKGSRICRACARIADSTPARLEQKRQRRRGKVEA